MILWEKLLPSELKRARGSRSYWIWIAIVLGVLLVIVLVARK